MININGTFLPSSFILLLQFSLFFPPPPHLHLRRCDLFLSIRSMWIAMHAIHVYSIWLHLRFHVPNKLYYDVSRDNELIWLMNTKNWTTTKYAYKVSSELRLEGSSYPTTWQQNSFTRSDWKKKTTSQRNKTATKDETTHGNQSDLNAHFIHSFSLPLHSLSFALCVLTSIIAVFIFIYEPIE